LVASPTVSQSALLIFIALTLPTRAEADAATERAELAEAKSKKQEQELLAKDQEITSLQNKVHVLEAELEKAESGLKDARTAREEGDSSRATAENLTRKVQLLEEELDAAEKNVKETVEKWVLVLCCVCCDTDQYEIDFDRLMSRRNISRGKCKGLSRSGTIGNRSTRYAISYLFLHHTIHYSLRSYRP
jgi:hypothetical protein